MRSLRTSSQNLSCNSYFFFLGLGAPNSELRLVGTMARFGRPSAMLESRRMRGMPSGLRGKAGVVGAAEAGDPAEATLIVEVLTEGRRGGAVRVGSAFFAAFLTSLEGSSMLAL